MKAFRIIKNTNNKITITELPPYSMQSIDFDRDSSHKEIESMLESLEGIYFLYNDKSDIYIGQTHNIIGRVIKKHFKDPEKKIFTNAFAITSEFLNKYLLEHIEKILIADFKDARNWKVHNLNNGTTKNEEEMSLYDKANFDKIKSVIWEFIGNFDADSRKIKESVEKLPKVIRKFETYSKDKEGYGSMEIRNGKYITLIGGKMPDPSKTTGFNEVAKRRYIKFYSETIGGKTQKEYEFDAPSFAAAIFTGTTSNGWTSWKDSHGKSLEKVTGRVKK